MNHQADVSEHVAPSARIMFSPFEWGVWQRFATKWAIAFMNADFRRGKFVNHLTNVFP